MKKNTQAGENLPLAIFFGIFVVGIIVTSLILKGVNILRQSNYDPSHQLIMFVKGTGSSHVLVFDPDTSSINILTLNCSCNSTEIGKILEVPIDSATSNVFQMPIQTFVSHLIISKENTTNMLFADKIRLWWFAKSVQDANISQYQLQLPASQDLIDSTNAKMFIDRSVYLEAKTITVENATGENGLATRFAKLLANIGANVIMVSSADNTIPKSSIEYIGDNSYTLSKIAKILQVKPVKSTKKSAISDITVILGEDVQNTDVF